MTNESKLPTVLLLLLMGIVILLMVAIAGLFMRMTQLQSEVLAALQPFQMAQPEGLETGTQASDFKLTDTDGQAISLTDMAGQRVLLVFSSTHCPACTEMHPHLKAFSQRRQDIQVLVISRGSAEENRQLVEEHGFGFPVLVWEDAVASDYQVPGTPFFYVLDGEGKIVNTGFGTSLEQLEELVKASGG